MRAGIERRHLEAFQAVAEELSFGRAAARLNLAQPTLSARIRDLEMQLDFILFERSTRRVELSAKGSELLPMARRLLEEFAQFHRVAESLRRGCERQLSIGAAFYTLDIPQRVQLLESFLDACPQAPLDVDTRWQTQLLQALRAGQLDLLLVVGVGVERRHYDQMLSRGEGVELLYPDCFEALRLGSRRLGLAVPRESELAACAEIPREALAGQQVATISAAHGRPIVEPIETLLEQADARAVQPPEAHGIGVERYGRQFRLPAVCFGWFPEVLGNEEDMVWRPIENFHHSTDLLLLRNPEVRPRRIERFWEHALSLAET